jgi:nicotinate-nucleotide--dimethylbenzimidazole phosphoribosyltransferase
MSLDLTDLAARVHKPDDDARADARARLAGWAAPGALGRLGELAEWLAGVQGQCPTRRIGRISLVVMAAAGLDQPRLSPLVSGRATPRVVQVPPFPDSPGPVDRAGVERAFRAGMAVADDAADTGTDLLVLADTADDRSAVAAAVTIAVLTGTDLAAVVGRGTGIDDREWMRRCAAVRDGARLARRSLTDGGDVLALLSSIGNAELAAAAGLVVQAAVRRTPVVLDGVVSAAAALTAHRVSPRTARWLVAGHASPDPGQAAALSKMRLRPLLDYAISAGDAIGALLAVAHVQAAAELLAATGERA